MSRRPNPPEVNAARLQLAMELISHRQKLCIPLKRLTLTAGMNRWRLHGVEHDPGAYSLSHIETYRTAMQAYIHAWVRMAQDLGYTIHPEPTGVSDENN